MPRSSWPRDSTIHVYTGGGADYPVAGRDDRCGHVSPAVGDGLDGSPTSSSVTTTRRSAPTMKGTPLAGWPVTVANGVRSSPALADVAGNDGQLEVIVASTDRRCMSSAATARSRRARRRSRQRVRQDHRRQRGCRRASRLSSGAATTSLRLQDERRTEVGSKLCDGSIPARRRSATRTTTAI